MLENLLIGHCSPTLAGIKTGSLFNCYTNTIEELMIQLLDANKKLILKRFGYEMIDTLPWERKYWKKLNPNPCFQIARQS